MCTSPVERFSTVDLSPNCPFFDVEITVGPPSFYLLFFKDFAPFHKRLLFLLCGFFCFVCGSFLPRCPAHAALILTPYPTLFYPYIHSQNLNSPRPWRGTENPVTPRFRIACPLYLYFPTHPNPVRKSKVSFRFVNGPMPFRLPPPWPFFPSFSIYHPL